MSNLGNQVLATKMSKNTSYAQNKCLDNIVAKLFAPSPPTVYPLMDIYAPQNYFIWEQRLKLLHFEPSTLSDIKLFYEWKFKCNAMLEIKFNELNMILTLRPTYPLTSVFYQI